MLKFSLRVQGSALFCKLMKNSYLLSVRKLFVFLALFVPMLALAAGPPVGLLNEKNPNVQKVMQLQNAMTPDLMTLNGILGTATGQNNNGQIAVVVYLNQLDTLTPQIVAAMPKSVRGTPIVVELTDPFKALKGPPGGGGGGGGHNGGGGGGGGVSHTAKQTDLPIKLGTSGGWSYDLANGYCCGGTLGSLIKVGNQLRILSNYHVFEADIVDGGNQEIVGNQLVSHPRVANNGDPIIQPGLIDVGCRAGSAQEVATLVVSHSLPNSNVDASSATIVDGMVDPSGAILEIGTISSQTVGAFVGQNVKKSGRTTGLSRSSVDGLNATVSVSYENECAGGSAFTKTFTGQIIVKNRRSKFLDAGDSGSLMVEDVNTNPRAIGLLFAGSSRLAVANPIDEVLDFFGGATMVGN